MPGRVTYHPINLCKEGVILKEDQALTSPPTPTPTCRSVFMDVKEFPGMCKWDLGFVLENLEAKLSQSGAPSRIRGSDSGFDCYHLPCGPGSVSMLCVCVCL